MCRSQSVLVIALVVRLAYSWDIAVTAGDRLEFYTNDGIKTDTVRFNSQNLTALAYDEVHNMLLYVDKQSDKDAICGYNMTSVEYKCYIQRNGRNIQSLAFDPVTEILFFTDTTERSINWFSLKSISNKDLVGNLLIEMDDGIPTDIVVDSCRGYIYWINRNLKTSRIERARFDASEREVVIYATYKLDLRSLAIGQDTQKIYWIEPETRLKWHLYSADLNGNNWETIVVYTSEPGDIWPVFYPNTLTISKKFLWSIDWCSSCGPKNVWKYPRSTQPNNHKPFFRVPTESVVRIAANYKIKEEFQGISECNHVRNYYEISIKNTTENYLGQHWSLCRWSLNGQSVCKCTLGYTGVRCEVSVCKDYCLQGNCSITEEGLPKCRCNAGYTGERCEVKVCHGYCSNNGICSLNAKSEPVCQCKGGYMGDKCEISNCLNYCLQGNCSITEQGLPICRCNVGFSGERCEVNICNGYCLNSGTCFFNEEDEPGCECVGEYEGARCEVPIRLNNGDGSLNKEDESACQLVVDGKLMKIRLTPLPLDTQEKES